MVTSEWKIQSRSTHCHLTQRPFDEGERIYSALYSKEGQYERVDFCSEAWEQRDESSPPLCYWKHSFQPPAPPPPEPMEKDTAESLLKRLLQQNDPSQKNVCYILALLLERKKLLKCLDRHKTERGPLLIYEHTPSGDTWVVEDPEIKLAEIGPVQEEVARLLGEKGGPLMGAS